MAASNIAQLITEKLNSGELVPTTRETDQTGTAFVQGVPFPAVVKKDGKVQPDLSRIPARLGMREAARFITQFYWPVSPRSMERWKGRTVKVGGRRLCPTADLVRTCEIILASAPVGGSAPRK
jgi:hypothetical protein